tara:strand:- start:5606 stop:5773 length:168 start_codon:yes stop_codon:yes gene_type:complete
LYYLKLTYAEDNLAQDTPENQYEFPMKMFIKKTHYEQEYDYKPRQDPKALLGKKR